MLQSALLHQRDDLPPGQYLPEMQFSGTEPRDFCREVDDDLTIPLPATISKFVVEIR
jgi:hypothetical protein